MKNNFIKESFINALTSSVSTFEEAQNVYKEEQIPKGVLYTFINRNIYLKEAYRALNTDKQKLISVTGFQGTGKTEFVNTLIRSLEENVLNFYYECSAVTHLDDIILSLFNYLKKILSKNPEYKRDFKISNSRSVDERLMNGIKSLNRPLLVVIDGFENLNNTGSEAEYKEVVHFTEFLSSLPGIKIIIAGRKISFDSLKASAFEIKLGGLEDQEAYKILKDNGITENESGLLQIFQVTRGYPENLLWFAKAVNLLQISPFELMKEYYSQDRQSFEEFVYQKIYISVPEDFRKTICFFAAIRHSLDIATAEKLNFASAGSANINYLSDSMILTKNRDVFYIKSLLKNMIYSGISQEEKQQIHRYFYELYSEQISKKLEERIFPVSRKLLYSEQYYHYMCLINCGDKSLPDIKTATLSNLKPDFKYLYANPVDSLFTGDKNISSQAVTEKSSESQPKEKPEKSKKEEEITHREFYNISDSYRDIDIKIELSEEEKALLDQEEQITETDADLNLSSGYAEVVSAYAPVSPLEDKAENIKSEANRLFEERKFDKSIEKFKECLILYENIKDTKNINLVLISTANAYNECFRHDIALMYYHKILNSENLDMEAEHKIEALCGTAGIYDYRNDYDNALKFYQTALAEAKKYNYTAQEAKIYFKTALVYDDLGDFDKALEFYLRSAGLSENTETNPNIAASYANIAAIYEEREDLEKAKEYYTESLKFDKIMNNKEGRYESLSAVGNIYFEQHDYEKADECFHEALEIAKLTDDSYKTAMSCLDIGDIHLRQKHYEKALKAFIIAGKTIEKTISTDSREKIDRRFKKVINEIGEDNFKKITEKLKRK